jgi:hypothetical protein
MIMPPIDQDLLQVLAVDRAHDHPLEGEADRTGHRHGHQHRDADRNEIQRDRIGGGERRHRCEHRHGHEGAERDEQAVAEVQHVHQPEDQREPGSDDEDDHAHREARNGERRPARQAADQRQGRQRQQGREQQRHALAQGCARRHGGTH